MQEITKIFKAFKPQLLLPRNFFSAFKSVSSLKLHFSPKSKIIILTSLILLILSPLHSTIINLHFHDQWNLAVAGLVVQAQGNGVTQTDTTDQSGSATFSIPYVSVGEHPSSPYPALIGPSIIRGKGTFTLSIPARSSFPISVFDATGRKIIHRTLSLEPGTYTITLSLSHTGVFFLSTPYSTLKLINLQPADDHISIRPQGTSSPQSISSNEVHIHIQGAVQDSFFTHPFDTTFVLTGEDTVNLTLQIEKYYRDTLEFRMNGTPVHGFTAIINGDSVEVSEGTLEVENTGYDSTYNMRVVVSDSIGSVDTLLRAGRNGRFTVELNPATYTSHLNLTIYNQWNTPMRHIMVIVGADTFYTDTSGNVSIPLVMNYGDTVEVEPVIEGVHYDSTELSYVVPYGVDVTDTVELNQYWNVTLGLIYPDGNNFQAGQVVYVSANPDGRVDTLTTDPTGSVSFRDYGLGGSFAFHVWGDENIVFDTTINNVNSDTSFSFVAPQNIYVNLPDSVSFPEDSSTSVPFVVNAPYGYDSVNVYSSNGVVNASINGDSLTISGNNDANGLDNLILTIFGSDGTTKQDTIRVNVLPMSDVYLKVVNSDLTDLTDFDSVRVDVKNHSYVFNPNDVLHLQLPPNDTVNFYIGGYQGDSLGSFVINYYQIIPNNDVNDTTLARIFPYENFKRSAYYNYAIAPKDSVLSFIETATGLWTNGQVDFDHVHDSLPPYFPVPPNSPHGMKIIIFRNINPDVFPYDYSASLTQEQVDSIQTWIHSFFDESNSLQFMPEIIVADLQDSTDWYQYFQHEGTAKRPHPGEIIINGNNAANAYAAFNFFNDNAQGYIYRGGASVDVYNVNPHQTMEEFFTALIIPNEMNTYRNIFPGYSVTVGGARVPTDIDRQMLHIAETIKYWVGAFGVPLLLGEDSVNVNGHYYPVFKISAGTYFNGMEHPNGMLLYNFPGNR